MTVFGTGKKKVDTGKIAHMLLDSVAKSVLKQELKDDLRYEIMITTTGTPSTIGVLYAGPKNSEAVHPPDNLNNLIGTEHDQPGH